MQETGTLCIRLYCTEVWDETLPESDVLSKMMDGIIPGGTGSSAGGAGGSVWLHVERCDVGSRSSLDSPAPVE